MAADKRTKKQKLQDMANQSASPNEAEIARAKLEELKDTEPTKHGFSVYVNGVRVDHEIIDVQFNFGRDPLSNLAGYYDFQKEEWVWSHPDLDTEKKGPLEG